MKKLIVGLLLLAASGVQAGTLKGGYPACLTKDALDQAHLAYFKEDWPLWDALMASQCIISKPGLPFSILETSWLGSVKVRVYVGDQSVVLWTVSENVSK